jgi:hypothetical protein
MLPCVHVHGGIAPMGGYVPICSLLGALLP